MDYLQNKLCYQLNPRSSDVIHLTKNYRSHPEILRIPNELFYGGRLEPLAETGATHWFIDNPILPNRKIPIVFESTKGECKQPENSTSFYNEEEAETVINWVRKLLDRSVYGMEVSCGDIGIISPYNRQCEVIKEDLYNNGYEAISVGSAEVFQGQERRVIIISTVRTENGDLGFVGNSQRFNVMITRAISLLIIVGDQDALYSDANWKVLIDYCIKNDCLVRAGRKLHRRITAPESNTPQNVQ